MGRIILGIRQRLVHKEVIIVFVRGNGGYRHKVSIIHWLARKLVVGIVAGP